MVSQITLGNASQQNGRTVITGTSSGGIDTAGLADALAKAKRQPAVILEDKIKANTTKITALGELKTTVSALHDAANFLRNPPGVGNASDNIFKYRTSSVTSDSSVAGDVYLGVTAVPGTQAGTFSAKVTQVATQNIQTTDTFALADADTSVVGGAGALNAGVLLLGANSTPITLTAGDTLNQVVAKINASGSLSGVLATATKISTGNYRLTFKTVDTGVAVNYDAQVLNPGMFNVAFSVNQPAVDAILHLDGTDITRSTNSFSDVIDGITFDLKQATPLATNLSVEISADNELIQQGIMNFVDAYNAFRIFAAKQTELDESGKPKDTAILATDQTLRMTISRLSAEMAGIVNGLTSGDPSRLSDLGITMSDLPADSTTPAVSNILTVDTDKLSAAITADVNKVRKVFEFDFASDNPDLQVFSRTNSLATNSVVFNLDQTGGIYQATYGVPPVTVDLDITNLTGGGLTIRGQSGTALDGLVMVYGGSLAAPVTINADLSQGIGDRVFNSLDGILKENTGDIAVAISTIDSANTRYETEVTRIDDMIAKFRESLLEKFSLLEKSISTANTLLATLTAQANAQLAASGN